MEGIASYLRAPSSFPLDPIGFARNQGGHAGIGMLLTWVFGVWFIPVVAFLYAAWEALQWRRYGADDWDCVQDWCFVVTGAFVPSVPWLLVPLAGWLLAGYLRRLDAAP
jgi:hypothetical protein